MKGLRKRAVRGVAWTLGGQIASNAVKVASLAILGRLLLPEQFGEVAAAMTIIALATILKDLGVGLALVQRKELEREHVEVAFAFSVGVGGLLALVLVAAAPFIADFYGLGVTAVPLVRLLAILFLLRGIASVPSFLCQRDMRFRALATIDVIGYVIGTAVAVSFAAAGHGSWSLAYGYIVDAGIGTVLLLAVRRPPVGLRWRWARLRELLGFGTGMTISRIANYFAAQGDYMVVGRVLGATQLGLYNRAYELVRFPANAFSNVAGGVLFSAFSRLQDDPVRLGRALRRGLFTNAVFLIPASFALIVLAPEIVWVLLGEGWTGAVLPFRVMAVCTLFGTSYKLGGLIARGSGDAYRIAVWQVVYAAAVVGGALVGARWGIVGVATGTAVAIFIHFINMMRIGKRRTTLTWGEIAAAHVPGLACGALCLALTWPVAALLRHAGLSPFVIVPVAGLAGVPAAVAFAAVSLRKGRSDWEWLWSSVRQLAGRKRGAGGSGGAAPESGSAPEKVAGRPA
jgi:PST family polysaccharide transporter